MNNLLRQDENTSLETVVDLRPVFAILMKRWYFLLLSAAVFGVLAWYGSHVFLTPTYKTNCRVYVNNMLDPSEKTSVSSSDLSAARSLASTYAEIIRGRSVLEEAAKRVGLYSDYSDTEYLVSVSTSPETEIITISVESTSPEFSYEFTRSIAEVAAEQVANIVDGSSMRVIDEPYVPKGISSPNYRRNALLGAALGLLLAMALLVLRVLLDTKVRDEEALEKRFGVVILGSIPNFEDAHKAGSYYAYYGYGKPRKEDSK